MDDVVNKVPPLDTLDKKIKDSEKKVVDDIKDCQNKLDVISSSLVKPSVKGLVGEKQVQNVLNEHFPGFTVTDVSTQARKGDILVETTRQHKIMIEVKNRQSSNVPQTEIDRFRQNLANSRNIKVGILFSMKSGIANKASNGKFEVKSDENQYQIYVPNAGKEESLIVWSVLLADELAQALHGKLGTSQVNKLGKLYEEFNEIKQRETKCRNSLSSLETSAKDLRENLDFIDPWSCWQNKEEIEKATWPERGSRVAAYLPWKVEPAFLSRQNKYSVSLYGLTLWSYFLDFILGNRMHCIIACFSQF